MPPVPREVEATGEARRASQVASEKATVPGEQRRYGVEHRSRNGNPVEKSVGHDEVVARVG